MSFKEMIKFVRTFNGEFTIQTINKSNGYTGVATVYPSNDSIKVYEGASDGSDDSEYTFDEFRINYRWSILIECVEPASVIVKEN